MERRARSVAQLCQFHSQWQHPLPAALPVPRLQDVHAFHTTP